MNRVGFLRERIGVNHVLWLLAITFLAFIITKVALRFSGVSVWDDAFMFVRYADNILAGGTVSFNPGGEATYGLTSIAFLAIVLPIRMLVPGSPALTAVVASSVCGILFIGLLIALLKTWIGSKNAQLTSVAVVLALGSLALAIGHFSVHFVTGMDTMFALAFITAYIFMSKWHETSSSLLSMLLTGCMGGLAFSVRPDLMIYAAIIPATVLLFAGTRKVRLMAIALMTVTGVVTLLQMLLYYLYLNSPLPLPFYAKGLNLYGEAIQDLYRLTPWRELFYYGCSFPLLFSVIAIPFLIDPKGWWRKLSPTDKGLFFATTVFIGYYLLFVLQIMATEQRFYYPTLPAFAFLAAQSMVFVAERLTLSDIYRNLVRQTSVKVVLIASLIVTIGSIGYSLTRDSQVLFNSGGSEHNSFDVTANYKKLYSDWWFCLDKFSSLPDDCSFATTEVGYPLAMNPGRNIIDIAGLNETVVAHNGFSSDRFFRKYQPDLIYMPHPHYGDMIRQINNDPYFVGHYEYFSSSEISAMMGIAIRKDSRCYARLREIVMFNCHRN